MNEVLYIKGTMNFTDKDGKILTTPGSHLSQESYRSGLFAIPDSFDRYDPCDGPVHAVVKTNRQWIANSYNSYDSYDMELRS